MKIPKFPPISPKKETIKGGGIVSKILAAEGVDTVFGIIDGSYFGLYSTFKAQRHPADHSPDTNPTRCTWPAAYARLTGRLGVCIASNGPGVANVLAGVALENAEGNRILLDYQYKARGHQLPGPGRRTFQYFPQADTTRPITKWSCNVTSACPDRRNPSNRFAQKQNGPTRGGAYRYSRKYHEHRL